jgi:hypothetical protein
MASEDHSFVVQVIEGRLYYLVEYASLFGPAHTAFLLWRTRELVEDGGVAHFHQGNLDMSAVVNAFQELGFSEAAKALQDSLTFFPADVLAGGSEERAGWLTHVYESEEDLDDAMEKVSEFFQPFTDLILELDPDGQFGTRLADFIRANPEAFSDAALNMAPPPRKRWPNRRAAMS